MAKKGLIGRLFGIKKKSTKIDVKELKKKVENNPKDLKAILKLGDFYSTKRKKNKAIEYYQKAAELCLEDGFINKGIAIVKKIATLDKKNPEVYQKLAELYMRQNLFGEATLQLQKALELNPDNEEIKETLGKLQGSTDDQRAIIESLRVDKEVQIASHATTAEEIIREAKEQIRKQITNEDVLEHYDLGVAYMEMELYESAIEEFGITLNSSEFFDDSIRLIYESFFSMDRIQDAIGYFEALLERPNISPLRKGVVRFHIGMAYEDSLETDKAIEIYEELLNTGYPKPDVLVQRIERLKHTSRLDDLS